MPEAAFREVMFQIQNGWIIYVLATLSMLLLAYSFYRRVRLWTLGQRDDAFTDLAQKAKRFVYTATIDMIIHRRILRDPYPGLIHALIFYGAPSCFCSRPPPTPSVRTSSSFCTATPTSPSPSLRR